MLVDHQALIVLQALLQVESKADPGPSPLLGGGFGGFGYGTSFGTSGGRLQKREANLLNMTEIWSEWQNTTEIPAEANIPEDVEIIKSENGIIIHIHTHQPKTGDTTRENNNESNSKQQEDELGFVDIEIPFEAQDKKENRTKYVSGLNEEEMYHMKNEKGNESEDIDILKPSEWKWEDKIKGKIQKKIKDRLRLRSGKGQPSKASLVVERIKHSRQEKEKERKTETTKKKILRKPRKGAAVVEWITKSGKLYSEKPGTGKNSATEYTDIKYPKEYRKENNISKRMIRNREFYSITTDEVENRNIQDESEKRDKDSIEHLKKYIPRSKGRGQMEQESNYSNNKYTKRQPKYRTRTTFFSTI